MNKRTNTAMFVLAGVMLVMMVLVNVARPPLLAKGESPTAAEPDRLEIWLRSMARDERESPDFPINLNEATLEDLVQIPQLGDITARRILRYREFLGGYTSLDQLRKVYGVGTYTYSNILPYLYIGELDPE